MSQLFNIDHFKILIVCRHLSFLPGPISAQFDCIGNSTAEVEIPRGPFPLPIHPIRIFVQMVLKFQLLF